DDDLGRGEAEVEIGVANVAPANVTLSLDQGTIAEDGTTTLSGTFTDPGVADTFTVAVDWGDGSDATVLELEAGDRAFQASHRYLDDNPTGTSSDAYTISVEVLDDDTGVGA